MLDKRPLTDYYIAILQYSQGYKAMVKPLLQRSHIEAIARTFDVLADDSRLLILHTLQTRACYVHELCQKTDLKQANVSKQLGILKQAGLVGAERQGNLVHYYISEPMIFDICKLVCEKIERDARRRFEEFAPTARRTRSKRRSIEKD
jgi:DNA-binding transcriptional ArsR family regulator